MISEADSSDLLNDKRQAVARRFKLLFGTEPQGTRSRTGGTLEAPETLDLKAQVVHLAVEAYRRQVIKKDRLSSLAKELELPDLSDAQLLELAEAAR
jgi:hypothetical protein